MFRVFTLCVLVFSACIVTVQNAGAIDVYHVGNSLTWDSRLGAIQDFAESRGDTHNFGHHIRCSWSLTRMLQDTTNTCVTPTSFGTFEPALSENTWDAVTLQPHTNRDTTIKSEADAILSMIATAQSHSDNADTKFYIYAGWPTQNTLLDGWTIETPDEDDSPLFRRRQVYEHIYDRVVAATDAEVYIIPVGEVVYQLAQAIEAGTLEGITELSELYRDDIHLSLDFGRYAASVATFATLYGDDLEGITPPNFSAEIGEAINEIVWNEVSTNAFTGVVPEPSTGLGVLLLAGLIGRAGRRRQWVA